MKQPDVSVPRSPGREHPRTAKVRLFGLSAGLACLALIGVARGPAATAEQPSFRPGELWSDQNGVPINAHGGGVLFHGGTYYWFGEHKTAGSAGNVANVGVGVYSSTNLDHWRNEGIALRVAEDPRSDIVRGCILERPKVIFNRKTGKFVMWFHLEPKGQGYLGARSGVAVADHVTGPYRFIESFRPNAGFWPQNVPAELKAPLTSDEVDRLARLKLNGGPVPGYPTDLIFRRDFAGGQMARDMTLFVDDDGSAFHIYASEDNGTLQISQLSDDYLKPVGKYARLFPGGFNEGPALFKHGGKYWLITSGCTGWEPNAARLAVADSIWGPWQSLGTPWAGPPEKIDRSFDSQATFVLPVADGSGGFIFMADRWRPENAIDGRYVWLPVQFRSDGQPFLAWMDQWELDALSTTRPAKTGDRAGMR